MSSSTQEANQRHRLTHPTFSFVKDPKDLENLSLHESPYGDLTLRAARDLEPNSILFTLPFDSVLTYDVVRNTKLSHLIMDTAGVCCSPEILGWLNIVCWYKADNYDEDNIYSSKHLRALSKEPPNVSSWPSYLQDLLIGTNIYSVLDVSGKNDNTLGNVHVIQKALSIVEEVRQFILLANASDNNNDDDDDDSKAIHSFFIPEETSIFNKSSIGWARGHFVSRRFPELKPSKFIKEIRTQQQNQHTIGYGDRLSCFIPLLDLMNHNPEMSSTCTVSLEGTDTVVIRIGRKGVKSGDELIYRYGNLSNETLLQGYGFCLEDNDQDDISFRIRKHHHQQRHENITNNNNDTAISTTDNDGEIFFLKKGGVSGIPKEFWEAIAGNNSSDGDGDGDDDDQQLEIGLGDLQKLKEYVDGKLKDLLSAPGWLYDQNKEEAVVGATPEDNDNDDNENDNNNKAAAIHLDRVRKQFIQFYLKGQKEVLEKLHDDLVEMLQQCSDLEDVEEQQEEESYSDSDSDTN
ncbi:MAG: hypothetical protein ACI8RD_010033 [Bacillariaceae sp.]|jgi:hypothetical protein